MPLSVFILPKNIKTTWSSLMPNSSLTSFFTRSLGTNLLVFTPLIEPLPKTKESFPFTILVLIKNCLWDSPSTKIWVELNTVKRSKNIKKVLKSPFLVCQTCPVKIWILVFMPANLAAKIPTKPTFGVTVWTASNFIFLK